MWLARTRRLLDRIEARPHSFAGLLAVCTFTGIVRAVEEYLFFAEKLLPAMGVAMAMAYFQIALGLIFFLHKINRTDWKRTQHAVYLGIFVGVLPPLVDLGVYGFNSTVIYRYYVEGDLAQLPLFFYAPEKGAPLGEAIIVWLSIVLAGAYSYVRTQSLPRVIATLLATYGFMLLQFSFLPRALVYLLQNGANSLAGSGAQNLLARLALSFLPFWYLTLAFFFYLMIRPQLRRLLWQRLPHFVPFVLMALAGGHYSGGVRAEVYLAATAVLCLAATAAVQNDYFDLRGRRSALRPEKCDVDFLNIISGGLLAWLLLLGFNVVLPLIVIAIAAILYNYPQFRLRKIFPASLKIEGLWAASAYLSGMLIHDRSAIRPPALLTAALIFGGWSVVAAWKDFKDVRSDAHRGYRNLYTFLWKGAGLSLHQTHRWISGAVVMCFSVPVVFGLLTQQYFAAAALAAVGLVPVALLSFRPGMRRWFILALWVFSGEILTAMLALRI